MAPEVVNRSGHSMTADWWSLGVLMVFSFIQIYFPLYNIFSLKCLPVNYLFKARVVNKQ